MKHFTLKKLMLIVTLLTSLNTFAYDIQIDNIYYYVNVNDFTCEVTSKDANYNSYSGDIIIPETVTYKTKTLRVTGIGYNAFYNCTDLTSVTIGKSVTVIKENAFYNCSGLESITIPNSVTRIDNYAFSGCSSLKELIIEDGTNPLSLGKCSYSYTFDGWTRSANSGLFFKSPIETVYIGRNINNDYPPFYDDIEGGNINIKSAIIGNSVTNIRYATFYKCSNLTSLTIGNSVNKIEDDAFEGCPNLVSIYLEGTIPPIVEGDNFTKHHYMDATVYIPQGSLSTYQSADIWKVFWDIQEYYLDKYFYVNYIVNGESYATDSVKHGDTIILKENPVKEGHTFSGWSEVPGRMPANDITIEGYFNVNSYTITYKVDGEEYKTVNVVFGEKVELIDVPTKEGHTFSGWSEAPAIMPANDITIKGSFTVNSYNVQFVIDEEVYETATIEYGAEIELPSVPEKEGHTFSGWENIPETMPARDIIIQGSYIANTAIEDIYLDLENIEVYNLKGVRITETDKLTRGIYIINGNKTFIK